MNKFSKKVTIVTTTAILASSLALPFAQSNKIIEPTQNKAEAAAGWKHLTTVTGNTAARNLAVKMTAGSLLALVAKGAGGSNAATSAVGGMSTLSGDILGTSKTLYYTDKVYERKTLQGPEWKHNITFYKDKAKTKKAGSGQVIQRTVVKGQIAKQEK
ncbi:hypothetical protein MXL24_13555 [Mammaliicoccus sciuri]|uniref:hypothetical protein n=1 Tax=Mammaliicoccus sciuri TaxID=1296 RepID=UPI002DBC16BE|nr:hypothetical protein [Mammaliicoccus sciuri]MEB6256802.1 hypothetical protein [Mammaliicoccus sciuri]